MRVSFFDDSYDNSAPALYDCEVPERVAEELICLANHFSGHPYGVGARSFPFRGCRVQGAIKQLQAYLGQTECNR